MRQQIEAYEAEHGSASRRCAGSKGAMPRMNAGRSFTAAQWAFIQDRLAGMGDRGDSSAQRRLRLAVRLLYATGLRISEAVAARVGDLQWVEYPPDRDDDEPASTTGRALPGRGT